jgi:hypothetical protein
VLRRVDEGVDWAFIVEKETSFVKLVTGNSRGKGADEGENGRERERADR